MNLHEMNCTPPSKTLPPHQGATTTFLTTNLPLAVQENTKTGHHSSSTVSRRVFGPNDMVVMTTWVEKHVYSTVKATAVGKPVVTDSVRIPTELVNSAGCHQSAPPTNCFQQPTTECSTPATQSSCSTESSIPCPVPGSCGNPGCHQPAHTDPQINNSSQTTPSLTQVLSQLEDESEDQNEMHTDSEDEMCTNSEDEESDCID